jgi:drug/metabolite transporter (DMT)-like permease
LIPVILWKRPKLPRGRAMGVVLLLSITMIVLPLALLLGAHARISSATVAVLFGAMPLLLCLATPGVPRSALQATMVGLGAIALTVGASFSVAQAAGSVVVLLALASTGFSSLAARRELRSVHPLMASALVLGAAGLLLLGASITLERGQPVQWNREAIGSVIFLALVGGAPAYALYFWLLQRLEAYQAVTVQWIEPLVGMCESAFFLRLGLSFSMIIGSLVTLGSVLVVMRARAEDDDTVSLMGN